MKRQMLTGIGLTAAIALTATLMHDRPADAHCQVPCGIYDDGARISAMFEDAATIKKAMLQINELSGKHEALAMNQATRWVATKETHASNIISTISEYFLTQKIKVVEPGAAGFDAYLKQLAGHHRVLAAAMKTKQTVDPANAEALHSAIDGISKYWVKRTGS